MYRLNINKKNFGDIISLILFDKLLDETFVEESEIFNELRDFLEGKGLKTKLFKLYFKIDPNLRSKYKTFKKMVKKGDVSISFFEGEDFNEDYKQIIEYCVKDITKKENINEEKLNIFIDEVLTNVFKGDN